MALRRLHRSRFVSIWTMTVLALLISLIWGVDKNTNGMNTVLAQSASCPIVRNGDFESPEIPGGGAGSVAAEWGGSYSVFRNAPDAASGSQYAWVANIFASLTQVLSTVNLHAGDTITISYLVNNGSMVATLNSSSSTSPEAPDGTWVQASVSYTLIQDAEPVSITFTQAFFAPFVDFVNGTCTFAPTPTATATSTSTATATSTEVVGADPVLDVNYTRGESFLADESFIWGPIYAGYYGQAIDITLTGSNIGQRYFTIPRLENAVPPIDLNTSPAGGDSDFFPMNYTLYVFYSTPPTGQIVFDLVNDVQGYPQAFLRETISCLFEMDDATFTPTTAVTSTPTEVPATATSTATIIPPGDLTIDASVTCGTPFFLGNDDPLFSGYWALPFNLHLDGIAPGSGFLPVQQYSAVEPDPFAAVTKRPSDFPNDMQQLPYDGTIYVYYPTPPTASTVSLTYKVSVLGQLDVSDIVPVTCTIDGSQPTATDTATSTVTQVPLTATDTATSTVTIAPPTATDTATSTVTVVPPTATDTSTSTVTIAPPTATDTATSTVTVAPPTATDTATSTVTVAPPTATDTATSTVTVAPPTSTETPTETPIPSSTATDVPVGTGSANVTVVTSNGSPIPDDTEVCLGDECQSLDAIAAASAPSGMSATFSDFAVGSYPLTVLIDGVEIYAVTIAITAGETANVTVVLPQGAATPSPVDPGETSPPPVISLTSTGAGTDPSWAAYLVLLGGAALISLSGGLTWRQRRRS